jgi:hypothetical protein
LYARLREDFEDSADENPASEIDVAGMIQFFDPIE